MNYNRFIDVDYKRSRIVSSRHRFPALLIGLLCFFSVAIGAAVVSSSRSSSDSTEQEISSTETVPLQLSSLTNTETVGLAPQGEQPENALLLPELSEETKHDLSVDQNIATDTQRTTITVQSGDTLGSIFSKLDIYSELHPILSLKTSQRDLKSIRPGQKLHFLFENDQLIGMDLEKTVNQHLEIRKSDNHYNVEEVTRPFEKRIQVATGTINDSLFLSGQRAGMSDALIMELAGIFGWDIDFALDIRSGDRFTVLYEENYLDGEKVTDGTIIAAEFINAGHLHRAVEYTDSSGKTDYYDPSGKSMRKPFIRTPVDFARISSGFNLQRKHPILNTIRAHRGVDYAAAIGTPIKASGDGRVIFRGVKGGYGNVVIIKHGSTYTTLYGHMSKFARNVANGSRVRQGQIIGYVGKSGLATGPHLHYEFRVNGVHRNPLTVKLPEAQPLPKSEMARFTAAIAPTVAQLDNYSSVTLAKNLSE